MTGNTAYVTAHVQRTRARPIGSRQSTILAYARLRESGQQAFPSVAEIAAFLQWNHGNQGIRESLYGLETRGLIERASVTRDKHGRAFISWRVTALGWAQP